MFPSEERSSFGHACSPVSRWPVLASISTRGPSIGRSAASKSSAAHIGKTARGDVLGTTQNGGSGRARTAALSGRRGTHNHDPSRKTVVVFGDRGCPAFVLLMYAVTPIAWPFKFLPAPPARVQQALEWLGEKFFQTTFVLGLLFVVYQGLSECSRRAVDREPLQCSRWNCY
jgi:hypothetical protein